MKKQNLYPKKGDNLLFGQYLSWVTWFYLTVVFVSELFIKEQTSYSYETLSLLFIASILCFTLNCYFKVVHTAYLNFKTLKKVRHLNLRQCLLKTKQITTFESLIRANFINLFILMYATVNQITFYNIPTVDSIIFLTTITIQLYCFVRLLTLKKLVAGLFFPEVAKIQQQKRDKQKALAEAEKHLPWLKRTF
jgi:hypothetical protein